MWNNWLRHRDSWEKAFALLLGIMLVIVCLTFRDYGISWDDQFSHYQGADFLRWYASGFHDRSVMSTAVNEYMYGGFFNAVAAVFARVSPFRTYESIHLAIALTGLAGLVVAFLVGKQLGGSRSGFLAALILVLTPTFYGHWFINPKDLPFAVLYLAALYSLLKTYDHLPKPGTRRIAITGIAIGLALGIRVGGIILFGYAGMLLILWHIANYRKSSSSPSKKLLVDLRYTGAAFLAICIIAWLVMTVWWPFALLDPIHNPLLVIEKSTRFTGANFTNLYRGAFIESSMLPREYLPVMLLVTLPEFYALGIASLLVAAVHWVVRARRRKKMGAIDDGARMSFFVLAAFLPIAAAVIVRPTVYDGTRLFLFIIPPLAVVAALGLNWFFSCSLPSYVKALAGSLLLLIGCVVALDMVRIHPYEYAYFNRTSGGLNGAYARYDTDYWGTSYKEGMDWLSRYYKPRAPKSSIGIANPSNAFLTFYYIDSGKPETQRFRQVDIERDPDVILSITRWNRHLVYGGKVLHVVERMNTPLLYVIESGSTGKAEDSTMRFGLDQLYIHRDPAGAAREFRKVLETNPTHYGATSQLAVSLDQTGDFAEAQVLWARVREMANRYDDESTAQTAMERIGRSASNGTANR